MDKIWYVVGVVIDTLKATGEHKISVVLIEGNTESSRLKSIRVRPIYE